MASGRSQLAYFEKNLPPAGGQSLGIAGDGGGIAPDEGAGAPCGAMTLDIGQGGRRQGPEAPARQLHARLGQDPGRPQPEGGGVPGSQDRASVIEGLQLRSEGERHEAQKLEGRQDGVRHRAR